MLLFLKIYELPGLRLEKQMVPSGALETVSRPDSNLSETPETVETVETPETLETLETVTGVKVRKYW
jgi:hypothetical protein